MRSVQAIQNDYQCVCVCVCVRIDIPRPTLESIR